MGSEGFEHRPKSFTFTKNERLRSKIVIKKLFTSNTSDFIYPFKFYILPSKSIDCNQVVFSVPKKLFRRSVDRHLLIRRIKEAYRLNKHVIIESQKFQIAYIYIAKEILSFKEIEKKLYLTLQKINKAHNEDIS